jgi:transposase-like protein
MQKMPEADERESGYPGFSHNAAASVEANEEPESEFWHRLLKNYFCSMAAGERITQAAFAQKHGVNFNTFRTKLFRVGEQAQKEVAAEQRTPPPALPKKIRRIELNQRDIDVLTRLGHDRCNSVRFIGELHFQGAANPAESARKRLARLRSAGIVQLIPSACGDLAKLTKKGARRLSAPIPPSIHPRHLAHHLATLQAIEAYRKEVAAAGGRIVSYQLEFHIQAAERKGQSTRAGHSYDVAPDAVLVVEAPDALGVMGTQTIALEYYTGAYSEGQIEEKIALFNHYDAVLQVADSRSTAKRVERITQGPCHPMPEGPQ